MPCINNYNNKRMSKPIKARNLLRGPIQDVVTIWILISAAQSNRVEKYFDALIILVWTLHKTILHKLHPLVNGFVTFIMGSRFQYSGKTQKE